MKDYEINDATLAILPEEEKGALVLEEQGQYEVEMEPLEVLNYSCKYFGSSYMGRREGARTILSSGYKLPILVEESQNLVFFPTVSPEDDTCIWLSLHHIKDYYPSRDGQNNTIIEFKNGTSLVINISHRSFHNQLLRASRLESVIRNRKHEKMS